MKRILSILFLLAAQWLPAQCPQLIDGNGNYSSNPYWISCTGNDYTVYLQPDIAVGNYTVDWGDGSPVQSGSGIIPPAFISHFYSATTDTFVVTLTDVSNGCVITGVVVMEQTPSASIQIPLGSPVYGCAPATFDFQNASTNISPTTVFTWDFGDGSPIQTYDYTNLGQVLSHTYQPNTVNCEVAVTLTAENYCNQGNPSVNTYFPIQVWDIDNAQITASDILLCYPDTVVYFENTTNRNCYAQGNTSQRYEYWNFGDYWGLGQDSIIGWRPWGPPNWGQIPIAYPGIGTYNVMLIDSSFCGNDTTYITIQIIPPPTAGLMPDKDTICAGETITFTDLSGGGANALSWNFGDGSGWSNTGLGNQTHTYNTPGDYTITQVATITGGTASCIDTATVNIHVLPSPTANFNITNNNGCDTLTTVFTDLSSGAVAWAWDFGNGNTSTLPAPPAQFYSGAGTYPASLTVTSANGCQDSVTTNINVFQTPVPAFSPTAVCVNETAQFTDQSSSAPGDPIISWNWDFGDGNSSNVQNPTHQYLSAGTYNLILNVNTANCSATDTFPVTVENLPVAGFSVDTSGGCSPLTVTFTNTSSANATGFIWYFGDGDSSLNINEVHTFINNSANDTTFITQLIAFTAFGCSDTFSIPITVFSNPVAQFTSNALPDCAPLVVNFTNQSSNAVSYQWDFGDGSPIDNNINPSHIFQNQTLFINNYTVTLTATGSNGCQDTASGTITVYPEPQFTFSTNPDSGCSPLTVQFPSVLGAVSYLWDFGDGNTGTGPSPSHTYINNTTNNQNFTVQLIATSPFGCSDTTYGSVIVFPNPTASFTIDTSFGCPPLPVTITNNSTGATINYWFYGNGDTSTTNSAVHTYTYNNTSGSAQNYPLMLIVETNSGCRDTAVQNINVYPEIIAGFIADTAGCSPLTVTFSDTSSGATSWLWDFGDGALPGVTSSSTHTFINNTLNDTSFTTVLIVQNTFGCSDTSSRAITVYSTPQATFTATPVSQTYPDTIVNINNATPGNNWSYFWDFGDGNSSTLQNPLTHNYTGWGQFTITLVVSSANCSDSVSQTIEIIPPVPIASFSSDTSGCKPLTVTFTNLSVYTNSYFWDFGDGGTSTAENPTYTYYTPGNYTVTLTVNGTGGQDDTTLVDYIHVYPVPTAFFTLNPSHVFIPNQPVNFYNLSSYADTYFWDFGDGNTSTDEHPQHYYTQAGNYNVWLIASNQYNCVDSFYLENAVLAENKGEIQIPNAFTPNPNGSNGGIIEPGSLNNDVFHPLISGADSYELNIFNKWGELLFISTDVNVGWDGYYRNQLCKQDVYVYKIKVKYIDGRSEVYTGDVTLLR